MMTQVCADFSDGLRAALFGETVNRGLHRMMPASNHFDRLGAGALGSILPLEPTFQKASLNLRRLVVCVAIAHELGHLFLGRVAKSMENSPGRAEAEGVFYDEELADASGLLFLFRMREAGLLDLLVDRGSISNMDLVNAVAAFYGWNLSICIARRLVAEFENLKEKRDASMANLAEVAARWQKVVKVMADAGGKDETPARICSTWSAPCAEMLSVLLRAKGVVLDYEKAFAALYRLSDPESKTYALLKE